MGKFEFVPEHDGTVPVETAVYQALGAASVCWEDMTHAGVFDSDKAKEIGEALMAVINGRQPGEMSAANYRAMSLHALKVASAAAERLDALVAKELADNAKDPFTGSWERKLEADRHQREMSIALTHAGVYANLASSKGSEQSMEQLKDLAVPLPLTVAEPEPDHRAPLWRRLLRHDG